MLAGTTKSSGKIIIIKYGTGDNRFRGSGGPTEQCVGNNAEQAKKSVKIIKTKTLRLSVEAS